MADSNHSPTHTPPVATPPPTITAWDLHYYLQYDGNAPENRCGDNLRGTSLMAKNQLMVATESVKGTKTKVKKLNGPILMHIFGKQ